MEGAALPEIQKEKQLMISMETMESRGAVMRWLAATVAVMFALPFCVARFAPADAGMALCVILFLIANPAYSVVLGYYCGRNIRRMWHLPLVSSVTFLAGTWLFFDIHEMWFVIYATAYLAVGWVAMGVSGYVNHKRGHKQNSSYPATESDD